MCEPMSMLSVTGLMVEKPRLAAPVRMESMADAMNAWPYAAEPTPQRQPGLVDQWILGHLKAMVAAHDRVFWVWLVAMGATVALKWCLW